VDANNRIYFGFHLVNFIGHQTIILFYTGSKHDISDLDVDAEEELGEITGRLPPPATQRSNADGTFIYTDLLLPCAPPNYRPFLQEDEVLSTHSSTPTGSTTSIKRAARGSSIFDKVCFCLHVVLLSFHRLVSCMIRHRSREKF